MYVKSCFSLAPASISLIVRPSIETLVLPCFEALQQMTPKILLQFGLILAQPSWITLVKMQKLQGGGTEAPM